MAATNSGANVLRYSALFGGIVYGLYHQATINTSTRQHHINAKYEKQESLIEKAKAEWVRKTTPQEAKGADGGVISNPDDPKFDLEAYLNVAAHEEKAASK